MGITNTLYIEVNGMKYTEQQIVFTDDKLEEAFMKGYNQAVDDVLGKLTNLRCIE